MFHTLKLSSLCSSYPFEPFETDLKGEEVVQSRFAILLTIDLFVDIDQLTRILELCGTPTPETLAKITSEEVSV